MQRITCSATTGLGEPSNHRLTVLSLFSAIVFIRIECAIVVRPVDRRYEAIVSGSCWLPPAMW